MTVAHVGVYGVGFCTEQSPDAVERRVAPAASVESLIIRFHTPCPATGMLMNTASRHALLSAW